MPDPNTRPSPGIDYPDIHVHIEAIFHCTSCDNVLVGCYTCHEAMCYEDDEDYFTFEETDPLDIFWTVNEGYMEVYDASTGETWREVRRGSAVERRELRAD